VRLLRQWGSTPTLLGGDPVAEGLDAGAERRGLALVLLGRSSVAAGLGASVEGRGSDGSGVQCWRQHGSYGVGVEGGDDDAEGDGGVEGGDGKSGSLTVQSKISP
jgi:hypothetical protein